MTNGTSLKYWPVKGALCWIIGFVMSDHFCSLYQQHIHEALKRMWSMALQILNSICTLQSTRRSPTILKCWNRFTVIAYFVSGRDQPVCCNFFLHNFTLLSASRWNSLLSSEYSISRSGAFIRIMSHFLNKPGSHRIFAVFRFLQLIKSTLFILWPKWKSHISTPPPPPTMCSGILHPCPLGLSLSSSKFIDETLCSLGKWRTTWITRSGLTSSCTS